MLHTETVEPGTLSLLKKLMTLQSLQPFSLVISIPHAITYFVEAEDSETPVSFKGQSWDQIKKGISRTVSDYLR